MKMDPIDYNLLLQNAIRGVILGALSYVEKNGMPKSNHFVIRFATRDPKVTVPAYLRAKHPDEMTIVIQHWFEDLNVDEDGFAITLNFQDTPQRLYIPTRAITSFSDPGAQFGFCMAEGPELEIVEQASEVETASTDKRPPKPKGEGSTVVSLDQFRRPT